MGMDIRAALEEVVMWCAAQTAAGDPDAIEIDCHATICITSANARRRGRCAWRHDPD
jgi:hypothetical protein